jgi:Holliday junction resolvase
MIDGGLSQLFQDNLPKVHWQRIETGGTGRGIPDLNGCYQGAEAWVECKRTKHWTVEVRPEQVGWIERRTRAGGRVFLAVRRAERELWLLWPQAARRLRDRCRLDHLKSELAYCGWDWRIIEEVLFSDRHHRP